MNPPNEYVELMEQFMSMDKKAVKIDGITKLDAACLVMVAHLKELPVEVRMQPKKSAILVRKDK